MLTSKDRPETYRNVHSEDAEDGRTDRFFQGPEKGPRKKKCPRQFGPGHENVPPSEISQTHTRTHTRLLNPFTPQTQLVSCNTFTCRSRLICVAVHCCRSLPASVEGFTEAVACSNINFSRHNLLTYSQT